MLLTKVSNEVAVRRFFSEIWTQGNLCTADEILDPDFAFVLPFNRTDTIEAFKHLVSVNRTVFANLAYVVNDSVADSNKAAAWWTLSGKHVGEWGHVPASNKDVSIQGMSFFWFTSEGRISQCIIENDFVGLMRQIDGIKTLQQGL